MFQTAVKNEVNCSIENFCQHLDNEEIWISGHTHCEWIKRLTCSLIQSGAVTDDILSLLEPICSLKVRIRKGDN